MCYLDEHKLISVSQHGFLSKHSTCTNLLEALCDWSDNLDSRADTLVAYIDFAKAFDSMSIPKLLHKLAHIGLTGCLLSCIASFLSQRSQRVGTAMSDLKPLISGVPQGSVLGPVLFIIFINNICNAVNGNVCNKLYADDLKSYVKLDDATTGLQTFKDALLSINDWSAEWEFPVSYSKCSYMLISNSNNFQPGPISFGLHNLEQVSTIKNLGVLFNSQFNFSERITSIIVKAKQRLFLLCKC